jgi:superfamily II RNA helicase
VEAPRLVSYLPASRVGGADVAGVILDQFLVYLSAKGLALYPAQEEAILALYDGANVILNTPTGSGKSLVASALHFESMAQGRRSIYTSPIKALANEKFLALCEEFGAENVGMMTGDASVNPKAPIICCTAEILANMALRLGCETPFSDIIMDEFHYYSDRDRGSAWQIPLLTCSKSRFLLMSATLGDVQFFERSLQQLTTKPTTVIRSATRPVPLTFQYKEIPLHETIQDLIAARQYPIYMVNFTQRECAEEAQNLLSIDICSKDEKLKIAEALEGVRFSSPYGAEIKKILRHGIGIHHAGLLPKYRVVVERLAQKGLLKVICGTDTLGVGVNVPIKTVVFTKLCKFDGQKAVILPVRDFHQIAGRAGRKGFDDHGYVIAQAPEHVIENIRAELKAQQDPKKLKKLVRKKPPEFGFVMWTKDTFEKLIGSEPEPLVSRFQVSHGMLLQVLSREHGCEQMRELIRASHETPESKYRQGRLAFKMFRSLLERNIIEIVKDPRRSKNLRVHVDLQDDFSLFHQLSLYLLDAVKACDPYSESYALDILTLAESIVENPELILRRQLDRLKTQKMAEMKAEGLEYEERMAELEKLEHPKPNRDFIYETYNAFVRAHPWLSSDNIKPKSIAREMYEGFMNFPEYIREYDLQRSEGLLLRYLSEVYKVLVQTVPASAKDDEMESIIDYLGGIIRQVDSSLLDEWEKLKNPNAKIEQGRQDEVPGSTDITQRKREFLIAVRNESFHFVKSLARRDYAQVADWIRENLGNPDQPWTQQKIKEWFEGYLLDHGRLLYDRVARGRDFFTVEEDSAMQWTVFQTLVDEHGTNDVRAVFMVSLEASRDAGRPVLQFSRFEGSA